MAFSGHILLLNVYFTPFSYGGATIVAEEVARELVRHHGCRVTVISSMNRPDIVPYAILRTEVDGIQNFIINLPAGRNFAERYDNPQVTEVILNLIDDLQPDLVNAHCLQDLGIGASRHIGKRGLPIVLGVHDFWWLCEHQFMLRPSGSYCGQNPVRIENCRGCVDNMN